MCNRVHRFAIFPSQQAGSTASPIRTSPPLSSLPLSQWWSWIDNSIFPAFFPFSFLSFLSFSTIDATSLPRCYARRWDRSRINFARNDWRSSTSRKLDWRSYRDLYTQIWGYFVVEERNSWTKWCLFGWMMKCEVVHGVLISMFSKLFLGFICIYNRYIILNNLISLFWII